MLAYTGYTLFALRDRYRELKKVAPEVFPTLTALVSTTAPAYSVELIYSADGALLWAEDGDGRQALGPLLVGTAGVSKCVVDAIPGLYSLAVTPSGQSGDFSQADSPSVGEMLVLNPQGGALTVLAPTGTDATLSVSGTGIPSSNTHTVCAAVAENLIEDPSLTVGQAFSQALTDNSGLSTTLTLLGDPTVRVMAWPEPKPVLSEEVTLSEETLNALRAVAEAAGLFKDYEVVVSGLDGAARPIAELDDALACFTGLEPTVENGKMVVAYDFGVTGLRIEGTTVFVTLSVRGKEGSLTFAEDNVYAIAPQSLDGTQPLALHTNRRRHGRAPLLPPRGRRHLPLPRHRLPPHALTQQSLGKFYREDGLAWKPCGLHRSRWSRRPWDFHAIAPKGRLRRPGEQRTENGEQNAPAGRRVRLRKTTRRETEGGGRGQRRSRRAPDGARGVSRPQLRLCGPLLFPTSASKFCLTAGGWVW